MVYISQGYNFYIFKEFIKFNNHSHFQKKDVIFMNSVKSMYVSQGYNLLFFLYNKMNSLKSLEIFKKWSEKIWKSIIKYEILINPIRHLKNVWKVWIFTTKHYAGSSLRAH